MKRTNGWVRVFSTSRSCFSLRREIITTGWAYLFASRDRISIPSPVPPVIRQSRERQIRQIERSTQHHARSHPKLKYGGSESISSSEHTYTPRAMIRKEIESRGCCGFVSSLSLQFPSPNTTRFYVRV